MNRKNEFHGRHKPKCKLTGTDGNIYALQGRASIALENAGQTYNIEKMQDEILNAKNYDEALRVIMKYVEVE